MDSNPTQHRRRSMALLEALLVTIIWSSTFVIVKIGLETLGPLTLAGLRYFLGSLILLPFLFLRRATFSPIKKSLWVRLVLIGISSYVIGNGALFWGLKFIPAATGSFLMGLIPLLILIGGAFFLKEIPSRWQVLGVVISLGGSRLFFSTGLLPGESRGLIILAIGLLGFMSFSLLGRNIARYKELDTLRLTTLPLLIGGALSLVLGLLIEGWPIFTNKGAWVVAWLAIINTALGYLLYNHSLKDLTALEMNMVMNLSPLFTGLLAWLILGEILVPIQFIGMIIMISGVIMVQMRNTPFVKLN